jgi:hypothetical protein
MGVTRVGFWRRKVVYLVRGGDGAEGSGLLVGHGRDLDGPKWCGSLVMRGGVLDKAEGCDLVVPLSRDLVEVERCDLVVMRGRALDEAEWCDLLLGRGTDLVKVDCCGASAMCVAAGFDLETR